MYCGGERALGFKVVEQMASDWYRMVSYAWYAQEGVCDVWPSPEMQAGLSCRQLQWKSQEF